MHWSKDKTTATFFQVFFYLLAVFYILFYMPFGFEDTDTGYIFGSSWNIYNGQFPHRDFIYTRPAIPAYLHTGFLFISETYGYLLDRSFFYIQIFIYSFFGTKLLFETFSIESKSTLYYIASVAAIVTIHNYPPMGWNTIDGVFFCTIGMYFLLKKNSSVLQLLLGSLFIVLGTFSKQSFYFMPIFIFGYLAINKDFYRLKYYVLFGLLFVFSYLGIKYASGSLVPFWEQTFMRTSSSALVDAGIKAYYLALKFNVLHILGGLLLVGLTMKFSKKKYAYVLVNLIIIGYIATSFITREGNWSVIKPVMQILFMAAALYALVGFRKDKRYGLLLLLLTLSWSASVSNGFRTPIHFSLPIIFAVYLFFFSEEDRKVSWPIASSMLALYLVTFYLGYQYIYRDAPRKELSYSMGEVFPQLQTIKSDKETYDKYTELRELSKKYPNFTAIPSVTLAHYLTKTENPIGTDWPLDVEINDEAIAIVQQLSEKNVFVFMEKKEFTPQQLTGYKIIPLITENWKLMERGTHFDVYSKQ